MAIRLCALSYALKKDGVFDDPKMKEVALINIARAITCYVDAFPLDNFGDIKSLSHGDRTYQWRYGDPLAGAYIMIQHDLLPLIQSGNDFAKNTQTAMKKFMDRTSFSLTQSYHQPDNGRYFILDETKLRHSNGLWSDANRHHRMRVWITQTSMIMDYNEPLTSLSYWYHGYEPWAKNKTSILPEWEPQGSFHDLKVWCDTNGRYAHTFYESGIKPDGTISHHVGGRQDMAHFAYGFEWQAHGYTAAAGMLKNTHYQVGDDPYNVTADFLTYTYPKIMYKGAIDFQTIGRSHMGKNSLTFDKQVLTAVDHLHHVKSEKTQIKNEAKLVQFVEQLKDKNCEVSGNLAFWVNDFMVHRRGGNGETPYYMSVKMQSARTKGAEGFPGSGDFAYHNGSGVFQMKVDGKEYGQARQRMDWHTMPGVTEEWRTDTLPIRSKKKIGYNPNPFAGMVSDHRNGVAAFNYEREGTYSSAKAHKAYFINDDYALMLGSNIKRVRPGQGKSIVTTVDQVEWDKELTYDLGDGVVKVVASTSVDQSHEIRQPVWFH